MSQLATSHARIHARHAGFFKDVISIAIRALRSVPRDPEAVYPALVIPIFFFAINVGALQDIAERIPGIDYKAFQLPVAILFAVTGVSRAVTLVTDIQTGYFDRLSMTPVNRFALLLGLTVADFSLVVALTIPVIVLGFVVGVTFRRRPSGTAALHTVVRPVGPRLRRISLCNCAEDRQPGSGELQLSTILSVRVSDDGVRPAGGYDRLDVDRLELQPSHIPSGRTAFADHGGLGRRGADQGNRLDSWRRACKRDPGADRAPGPHSPDVTP